MKRNLFTVFFLTILFFAGGDRAVGGSIGDPGATLEKGTWALGPEISGVSREISDQGNVRYDTESWRLLLKGSYGITDWLEVFGRLGGATFKIRGTPFDSSLGIAAGGGLKGTFLDPPAHPLRYSLGGQFLYIQTDNQGATAKWFEYDIWLGASYKDLKNLIPYGGVVYSRVDGKLENFNPQPALDKFKSPTAAGIFFGIDWPLSKKTNLGIEARLFSENSGTLSLMYRF
jgi:hypothetical protein